jgi:hypothetical protein
MLGEIEEPYFCSEIMRVRHNGSLFARWLGVGGPRKLANNFTRQQPDQFENGFADTIVVRERFWVVLVSHGDILIQKKSPADGRGAEMQINA